ncbi:MAG: ABC transporter ATP-binding protein [Oscillospiraceae bacterium]|nr:ABC transporter ATP-binding protein [Oscillospiraceae bacterium]
MALLTIKNLEKRYPGVKALSDINMEIEAGKIVGLLGPNMSGKTTLLKTIAGMLSPDSGEIIYPNGATGVEARQAISFLPDNMVFPSWMKVRDAFRYYEDMYPDYSQKNAERLIELLELPMNKNIKKLSKGMKERVSLAVTFSRDTAVYLLDEPLGGIDPLGKMKIMEAILSVPPENSSILLSTHLVKDVENVFDSVAFIANGELAYNGDCEDIREKQGKTIEQLYLEVFQYVQTA